MRDDHAGDMLEDGARFFVRGGVSLFAGQPAAPVRSQPGRGAAPNPDLDQRAIAPAAVADAAAFRQSTGVGGADQPRYWRAVHDAGLEPDDASNRSERR